MIAAATLLAASLAAGTVQVQPFAPETADACVVFISADPDSAFFDDVAAAVEAWDRVASAQASPFSVAITHGTSTVRGGLIDPTGADFGVVAASDELVEAVAGKVPGGRRSSASSPRIGGILLNTSIPFKPGVRRAVLMREMGQLLGASNPDPSSQPTMPPCMVP